MNVCCNMNKRFTRQLLLRIKFNTCANCHCVIINKHYNKMFYIMKQDIVAKGRRSGLGMGWLLAKTTLGHIIKEMLSLGEEAAVKIKNFTLPC